MAGLREAIAFERGSRTGALFRSAPISARNVEAAPPPTFAPKQIAAIRRRLGLSQAVFARLLNVSPATARSWEQGVNTPGGPSSRLLQIAGANPEALLPYVRRRN
jgi:putative transcriptional regulator